MQWLQLQMKLVLGGYRKIAIWCGGNDTFDMGGGKFGEIDFCGGRNEQATDGVMPSPISP